MTEAESFSCIFSCSVSALFATSHPQSPLGFDSKLHGCGVVRMHVSASCAVTATATLTFHKRDAGWREGLMSLYNSWALSEESFIYTSPVISWQDSGPVRCFHLLFCWLLRGNGGIDKQRHKCHPPSLWIVLIICCRFWHGWTVWKSLHWHPQKMRKSYLQHKSHPGLSLLTGVHSRGSANPHASSSVFVRHWCTAADTQKARDKAEAHLTETQWHADVICVHLYAKHRCDSYHTGLNVISIIFMWGRRYEKHTCKGIRMT